MSFVMPNPSDTRTYLPEQQRRHRLRRALNELMAGYGYHIKISDEGRLIVGPKELMTPEAREFIQRYRDDLLIHVQWLGEGR